MAACGALPIIAPVIAQTIRAIKIFFFLAPIRQSGRALLMLTAMLSGANAFAVNFEDAESALRRGDYASAIPIYTTLADGGDLRAMVRLAKLLQKGEGTPRDLPRAVAYFSQAAKTGDAEAQYSLGNLYLLGEGVPQDDDWAFTYYRQAAAQGHPLAHKNVNEFYRAAGVNPPSDEATPTPPAEVTPNTSLSPPTGTPDPEYVRSVPAALSEDEYRAIEFARAHGIQVNNVPGQDAKGPTTPSTSGAFHVPDATPAPNTPALADAQALLAAGDTAAARAALVVLADEGNRDAQYLLAELLKTAGFDADTQGEALMWLQRAAEAGHADAQFALADAYFQGAGVVADEAAGITWLREAAQQGHAGARDRLAAIYRNAGLAPPPHTDSPHNN